MLRQEIPGYCTLCRSRCGTMNVVENGRLVAVKNNPDHPTGKATCLKGRAAPEIAHSARRLTTPLKRTAPRGAKDPGFVPISWEEALDTVAGRLSAIKAESGAESVAFSVTSPSSSTVSDNYDWIWRFIRTFGSPNAIFSTELCNWHKDYAHAFTFGCPTPTADYRNADVVILWGHNPSNVWLAQAEAISAAQARGARIVVIDPRQTATARTADLWLQVKPGTDAALAMGVSREMIARGLFNHDFVRDYSNAALLVREDNGLFLRGCDVGNAEKPDAYMVWNADEGRAVPLGTHSDESFLERSGPRAIAGVDGTIACRTAFDHFAEAVEPYDPETVERICGVKREQIPALAEMLGAAGAIAYHAWTGVAHHRNATQIERSIATLYALTDSFDKPGGNVRHPAHPVSKMHDVSMIPEETRKKALGLDRRPLGPPTEGWITGTDFCDAVLDEQPYAVRALFSFGSNLLVSQPHGGRGRQALEALDFHVHCNMFMNPTAEYADIILPVSVPWENEGLRVGFEISHEAQEMIQLRRPMIPRLGECRSDTEIVFALAQRLGMEEAFFGGDIEAGNNHILSPLGLTMEDLRGKPGGVRMPLPRAYQKYQKTGFMTETGRVEFYSEKLHRHGYPAVPQFVPPVDAGDDYPIMMFSVNNGYFCHSQQRGIASLRTRRPDPLAALHPDTAAKHGIADGDWIKVTTKRGHFQIKAQLDATIARDTLASDYGWWEPANDLGLGAVGTSPLPGATSYNEVIPDRERDPVSGGLPLRSTRCRVEKLASAGWQGLRSFRVRDKQLVTPEIASIELATVDGAHVPPFLAGQSITIALPEGQRSYSLTSPPLHNGSDSFTIAVRRIDDGAVSPAIVDTLAIGDVVELGAPTGRFVIPQRNEFPVVMIAGGIGITPFISYLRSLPGEGEGAPPRILLLYYCRERENVAFLDELDEYSMHNPHVELRLFLRNPSGRCGRHPIGQGRYASDHVDQALIDARARFYICASEGMIEGVTQDLKTRGVPAFEIFSERFVSPMDVAADVSNLSPREVTFARSGRKLTWKPQEGSLLQMAEASGISLPSGCRVGQCESCATRVLQGSVMHLSKVDLAEDNICLTCIGVPVSDLVLDA